MIIKERPNVLPHRLVCKNVSKARVAYFKAQRIKYDANRGRIPRGKQSEKAYSLMSELYPYIYYLGCVYNPDALAKGTLTE